MLIKEKILERGLLSGAKIIIPESNDNRIIKATNELLAMGYNIMDLNIYNDNYETCCHNFKASDHLSFFVHKYISIKYNNISVSHI